MGLFDSNQRRRRSRIKIRKRIKSRSRNVNRSLHGAAGEEASDLRPSAFLAQPSRTDGNATGCVKVKSVMFAAVRRPT